MTAGELDRLLQAWAAATGAHVPTQPQNRVAVTRAELGDLAIAAAELEAQRIARQLRALYERECPALFKPGAGKWIKRVEAIIEGRGVLQEPEVMGGHVG